jgi:hypothetical protein
MVNNDISLFEVKEKILRSLNLNKNETIMLIWKKTILNNLNLKVKHLQEKN